MKFYVFLDVTVNGEQIGVVSGLMDFRVEPLPGDLVCFSVVEGDSTELPPTTPNPKVKGRVHYPLSGAQGKYPELFFEELVFPSKDAARAFMSFLSREAGLVSDCL